MVKKTFHILGLPHTVSSKEYNACAYTQKVVKFGKMMTERGHTIIHYGHEDSDLICSEHVTVTTNKDLKKAYGSYNWRKEFFKFDMNDHAYQAFYKNTIREIGKRKKPNDFLLAFWGFGHKPVCDAHNDMIVVEPGIGYAEGHFANYRVFESYAIRSAIGGKEAVGNCRENNYHVVIPNYFDLDDFTFQQDKEDYFLFLGRVYEGKGVHIAMDVCNAIGAKLIIAGQGDLKGFENRITPNIDFIGYADVEKRRKLLSGAKALFAPSMYNEPFGGVQIEALLSGTPTITSNWGAFAENNIHGLTGYRCNTLDHFVWSAKNIDKIDPQVCRDFAVYNFALNRVAEKYEEYFDMVYNVQTDKGWLQENNGRTDLTWMNTYVPRKKVISSKKRKFIIYRLIAIWLKKIRKTYIPQ